MINNRLISRELSSSKALEEMEFRVEWMNRTIPLKEKNIQAFVSKEEVVILGESISTNSDSSAIDSYNKAWNNHIECGGIVVKDLKENFETVLKKIGKDKFMRVKSPNKDDWLLVKYTDVKLAQKYVNRWVPNAFLKEVS